MVSANSSTRPTASKSRANSHVRAARVARFCRISRSACTCATAPGLRTFTTTGVPSVEGRRVRLADRCRRHRPIFERSEDLLGLGTELAANHVADQVDRHGRCGILQFREFGDEGGRKQVRPRRQQLPELDEGRAELLERGAEVFGRRGGSPPRRVGGRTPPARDHPIDSEQTHQKSESMATQGRTDLEVTTGVRRPEPVVLVPVHGSDITRRGPGILRRIPYDQPPQSGRSRSRHPTSR